MKTSPIKSGWSYQYEIGIVYVESWGDPFLVVTEYKFWNGESWGYNYFNLGVTYASEEHGKHSAKIYNKECDLPQFFDSDQSQSFLLKLQELFPNAKIKAEAI